MTATYVGGVTIGQAIPLAASAVAAGEAMLAATLPSVQARLAGAIQAQLAVTVSPPSIEAAATFGAAAAASVAAAITAPSIGVNAGAAAKVVAEITAELGALEAQLAIVLALKFALGSSGIHMYLVEGEIGAHGSDLQSQLSGGVPGGSGPDQLGTGIYLVAADNGAIAALRTVFGV